MVKKFKLMDGTNSKQKGGTTLYSSMMPMIPSNMMGAVMSGQKIKGEKLAPNLSTLPLTSAMGTVPFTTTPMMPPILPAQPVGFQVMKPALPVLGSPLNNLPGVVTPLSPGPFIKFRPPSYNQRTNISVRSPRASFDMSVDESFLKRLAASVATGRLSPVSDIDMPDSDKFEFSFPRSGTGSQAEYKKAGIVLIVESSGNDNVILLNFSSKYFGFGGVLDGGKTVEQLAISSLNEKSNGQLKISSVVHSSSFDVVDSSFGKMKIFVVKVKNDQIIGTLKSPLFAEDINIALTDANVSNAVKYAINDYKNNKNKYDNVYNNLTKQGNVWVIN